MVSASLRLLFNVIDVNLVQVSLLSIGLQVSDLASHWLPIGGLRKLYATALTNTIQAASQSTFIITQLTLLSQSELLFTGRLMVMALKNLEGHLKKNQNQTGATLFQAYRSVYLCRQKPNLQHVRHYLYLLLCLKKKDIKL